MNSIVHKGGYNLRNKFQVNKPLRIYNHYGEPTFFYFYSNFINNFILNDLKINFYTFKKLLFYLCQSVKLQFFKSFIMPHLDYCSTLFCYFPKDL